LLLLAANLWADSPQNCTLRGRVVNALGNQPLKNARVQLKSADDPKRFYNVTTDAEGQFVFAQVVPGVYRVMVRHNRFVPGIYGQKADVFSEGGLLTLKPGEEVKDLLFRLVPSAAIVGQVVDEDGETVPGVEVQALVRASRLPTDRDTPPEGGSLAPIRTAVTNDLGQFRLYGLPPGEYFVSAVDSGMPELSEQNLSGGFGYEIADAPQPKYPPTYYPGTTQPSQAAKVAVRTGDEISIEFRLRRVDTYLVSGRVLDASGHPVLGANVSISPDDLATEFSSLRYGGETDSAGRFQIAGVAPGNYSVDASRIEDQKQWMAERPVTVSAEDVTGLQLTLLPPVKLSGHITFQGSASLQPGRGIVWLHPVKDRGRHFGAGEIRKDNTFSVEGLLPDAYTISVTPLEGDSYLASAHLGTADVLRAGLTITSIDPPGTLDLVISPNGASVEGVVIKAQKPVSGASVHIELADAEQGQTLAKADAETDQYGQFVFHALRPGKYVISAKEDEQSEGVRTVDANLDEKQHSRITITLDDGK
jgi:protocatechuate 3,4-dioxygenase beta subunit